ASTRRTRYPLCACALTTGRESSARHKLREPDELLAEVLAFEEGDHSARCVFESVNHGLAILELSVEDKPSQCLTRFGVAIRPVEHDHALHLDSIDEHGPQSRIAVGLHGVVLRDQPTDDNAGEPIHQS